MIKIDHVETYGWRPALRGMRNPMNSWNKADTVFDEYGIPTMGENDLRLATSLASAGTDHAKYLRMIVVYADVAAPLYWWKEFDTYKIGTVANSCSIMHKIHAKPFERSDFSHDHLTHYNFDWLDTTIEWLNRERNKFNVSKGKDKEAWWQMIQMLPSSYIQKRTLMLNYQVLKNIYHARCNHKLQEWHDFCDMIRKLPYAQELIIGER